jgi:hypothetical protein
VAAAPPSKIYLGDAVYADWSQYGDLVLTTEDGIRATNVIVLEPSVLAALLDYVQRTKAS